MKKLILFGGLFLGFVLIANPVMAKTGEPVKDVDVILDRLPGSVVRTTKPIGVDEVGINKIVQGDESGKPGADISKRTALANEIPVDFVGAAYGEPRVPQADAGRKPIGVDEVGIDKIVQSDESGKLGTLISEHWKKENIKTLKKTDPRYKAQRDFALKVAAGDISVDFVGNFNFTIRDLKVAAGDIPVDFVGAAFGEPQAFQAGSDGYLYYINKQEDVSREKRSSALYESGGWMKIMKKAKMVIGLVNGSIDRRTLKGGNRVALVGFGSFSVAKREVEGLPEIGVYLYRKKSKTKEMTIPAEKVVRFKAGSDLAKGVK